MFLRDSRRHRAPPRNFQCGERVVPEREQQQQQDADDDEVAEVGSVIFYCSPPPSSCVNTNTTAEHYHYLKFSCRKRSVGVLVEEEPKVDDSDLATAYETVDPNFFDPGYTLAGATGFQIWAGTRLLVESLVWPKVVVVSSSSPPSPSPSPSPSPATATATAAVLPPPQTTPHEEEEEDHPILRHWQERIICRRSTNDDSSSSPAVRILELGAGIGVLGTNLAAAGAQVLLTDLSTLSDNATYPNLLWNHHQQQQQEHRQRQPKSQPPNGAEADDDDDANTTESSSCPDWLQSAGGRSIGSGWAATVALDWTRPVADQLSLEQQQYDQLDLIVASDCVWLVSMLDALLDTVAALFAAAAAAASAKQGQQQRQPPTLLMSFQRRDTSEGDESATFTTVRRVIQSVEARGWHMECLAWRPVQLEQEQEEEEKDEKTEQERNRSSTTTKDDDKEVFVFAIDAPVGSRD